MTLLLQGAGIQALTVTPAPPVLLLDLEADTLSAGAVATWPDQSGNGNDFTQTGSAQPTAQIVLGYMAVVFDGVDDWMLGPNIVDNIPMTVITVRPNPSDLNKTFILTKIANDACDDPGCTGWSFYGRSMYLYTDTSNYLAQSVPFSAAAKEIIAIQVVSSSEIHAYSNGVLSDGSPNGGRVGGSGVSSFSNSESIRLGTDGTIGVCDSFSQDVVYAIRIYAPPLNDADRATVEAELAARYGVTL